MNVIEWVIRLRNPSFRFDPRLSFAVVLGVAVDKAIALARGALKLLLHGRRPGLVFFGRGVRLVNARALRLGRWVQIGEHALLSAVGTEGLTIGDNCSIGAFSRIAVATTFNNLGLRIRIGRNVGIGEFAHLGGAGGLEIGDDCIVGSYFSCHPENHNFGDIERLIRSQGVTRQGIVVERNCWIGAKVTICDGVRVGEGSVIAAGAVLTRSTPPFSVVAGVPARVIKRSKPPVVA